MRQSMDVTKSSNLCCRIRRSWQRTRNRCHWTSQTPCFPHRVEDNYQSSDYSLTSSCRIPFTLSHTPNHSASPKQETAALAFQTLRNRLCVQQLLATLLPSFGTSYTSPTWLRNLSWTRIRTPKEPITHLYRTQLGVGIWPSSKRSLMPVQAQTTCRSSSHHHAVTSTSCAAS